MAIVTLARELGTMTPEEQKKLFASLGKIFIHKEIIEERFRELKMDPVLLERFDEKKPGVFGSIFTGERDLYMDVLKTVLFQEAALGNRLIVGRGGNILLKVIPNCLRLRLTASLDKRKERIAEQENCTLEQAEKIIEKSDRNRSGFCRFHFDQNWRDEHLYDLIINTDQFDFDSITAIIATALKFYEQPERETAGQKILQDLALSYLIQHRLLVVAGLPIRFFEAVCENGHVQIRGLAVSSGISNRALHDTESIPGVKEVENQIQIVLPDIPHRYS